MPLVLHPESTCDICLEPFCDALPPHIIPCGHIFCEPCFKSPHYRQHLCGLCREPYRPERVKRIHVDMKYANTPQSLVRLNEEVEDQAEDGSLRRTQLPTDQALLLKLATALDLRSGAPVKRLKTALRQANKWKNANTDSPCGLALKNLLRFVDDYRFATDQCTKYEAEVQRLTQLNSLLSWPESGTETHNSVNAMREELKDTQKQLKDLTREMASLKAMSPMVHTPPEPTPMGLSSHEPLRQGDLDAQRRFLQGYIDGAQEMQRTLSSLSSPSRSVDSHLLDMSDYGLATPSSLGSGSPLQSLMGDWEAIPAQSPSMTPTNLADVSRRSSRRSRQSDSQPIPDDSSVLRSPPRAPRIGSRQPLPLSTSTDQINEMDRVLSDNSRLFRPARNGSHRSAMSARTELSWGTSTSGNSLNRLPLGQLPIMSSTLEEEGRLFL